MRNMEFNRKLLVTGGTGSFGNTVLRKFLKREEFSEIRIFSRDEKKQDDMRHFYNNPKIKYYIGDTRDKDSIDIAMRGVNYVFHAAALKQVPSCEFFPIQAVNTNILGTNNVLESAIKHNVSHVVVLSTDKAVYPINAMGMSKALSEKVMIAKSRELIGSNNTFCGTRYGNVMASRGSVIPLFIDQIKNDKQISITDPDMTRFMMTLDDAVGLVWFAFNKSNNGDIFVQKAPAVTIEILAKALQDIYHATNDIKIIGTRHGEKLYETLVNREEMAKAEDHGKYYRISADNRDLNYGKYYTEGVDMVTESVEYTSHNTKQLNIEEMKELLLTLPIVRKDILNEDLSDIYEP